MTDSEIIELLETCGEIANCKKCSFYNAEKNNCLIKLNTYALDLINRQQTELEKAKSEAVREFAEKLRRESLLDRGYEILQEGVIETLIKEMTEGDND